MQKNYSWRLPENEERIVAIRIGLISDTHGLLRPEAMQFLQGSDMIIHCGDICDPGVLKELSGIAPVKAVRGNNDKGAWADDLPESEIIPIGEIFAYVIHDIARIDVDPAASGVTVVLAGHSHKPCIDCRDGVTYINPGSGGPRRFKLPISAGELIVERKSINPRLVEFTDARRARAAAQRVT
jgi:putative phosphoesterase